MTTGTVKRENESGTVDRGDIPWKAVHGCAIFRRTRNEAKQAAAGPRQPTLEKPHTYI